jgi:hypothetical protein
VANETRVQFITPVGRLLGGSVSVPRDKDAEGKPLLIKSGLNQGKPTVQYYLALAIAKGTEQHWANTEWGAKVWQIGHAAFPGIAQAPAFAWKIEDGDSAIPNTKGKKPCDREGYKGHWILHLATSHAPKACTAKGTVAVDPAQIKAGFYVSVAIMCQGNGSTQKPGVYLNPQAVNLEGEGDEIIQGVDTASAFANSGAALPAGARPLTNLMAPPAVPGAPSAAPPVPAVPANIPAGYTPGPVPGTFVPPANPAILAAPPAVPGVPVPAAAPAAPAGPVLTPKAAGFTYQQLVNAGWTDETLRANGYIL